jgi:hypothetical protein
VVSGGVGSPQKFLIPAKLNFQKIGSLSKLGTTGFHYSESSPEINMDRT